MRLLITAAAVFWLAGCQTARRPRLSGTEYKLITFNGYPVLLPPPVVDRYKETPLSIPVALQAKSKALVKAGKCIVSNDLFQLRFDRRSQGTGVLELPAMARWQTLLEMWDQPGSNEIDQKLQQVLDGPEVLEKRGCLGAGTALAVRQLLRDSLPMLPSQGLFREYGYKPGSGGLDLRPGVRLTIQRAYFKDGARPNGKSLDGYIGVSTALYDCVEDAAGRAAFQPLGVKYSTDELRSRSKGREAEASLARVARPKRLYRLLFLTLNVPTGVKRSVLIVGASTMAEMEAGERQLSRDAGQSCGELAARGRLTCISFGDDVTVTPEVRVTVNGQVESVAWGDSLKTLLAKRDLGEQALASIRLSRRFQDRLLPVKVEGDPAALLDTMLVGGDQVVLPRP